MAAGKLSQAGAFGRGLVGLAAASTAIALAATEPPRQGRLPRRPLGGVLCRNGPGLRPRCREREQARDDVRLDRHGRRPRHGGGLAAPVSFRPRDHAFTRHGCRRPVTPTRVRASVLLSSATWFSQKK